MDIKTLQKISGHQRVLRLHPIKKTFSQVQKKKKIEREKNLRPETWIGLNYGSALLEGTRIFP